MRIHEIMKQHSITVTPKTSFLTIWKLMLDHKLLAIPVIDEYKKLSGIITNDEMLECMYPDYLDLMEEFSDVDKSDSISSRFDIFKDITAEDISNSQVIFARDSTDLLRAFSRMITRHVNQLPILDDNDHFIGMITKGDILDCLFKKQDVSVKSNIATV